MRISEHSARGWSDRMSSWNNLKELLRPYYLRWMYYPLGHGRRPAGFRKCWQYPYQRVGESTRLPDSLSGLPDLLFFPMTDWHTRIQRTQQLARAMAAMGYRCIYVNPHLGREFERTPLLEREHRLGMLEPNIFELHVRLPREPVFHDRLLAAGEEHTILSVIRDVLPAGGRAIQILSFPLWLGVASRLREESGFPMVYDCHDLLAGFHNVSPALIAAETTLFGAADLVLFASQGLADCHGGEVSKRWILVRNGVSAMPFQTVADDRRTGPPVAGYVGALDSWFDVDAVEESASLNPQCRFIVAGRLEFKPIGRLGELANVELIGEVPYEEVPRLVAQFNVALIPFRINSLTLMTNPIKLYEYFSRGLPVVTTPLPEVEAMEDLVYVGRTPAEFGRQVSLALREDDRDRRDRRRAIAEQESWTSRAREIRAELAALA
jgi:hypothetical protein